jgi:acyl carrier protein phosphodiesterase
MNFLAHCALAHDAARIWQVDERQRAGLLAGAVLGDFLKGALPETWPEALAAGTRLHRKVDAMSNLHPGVRESCEHFEPPLRRFAPIYVDLIADHCLSLDWQSHYALDLNQFSDECYGAIHGHRAYLDEQGARFLDYMLKEDLLSNYHQWRHIERGLSSVLRRLDRADLARTTHEACRMAMPVVRRCFAGFYPDLRGAWHHWNAFSIDG